MFGRAKVAMLVAEFFAAATLTLVVSSVASYANPRFGLPALFVGTAAGLTMGLMVLVVGKSSGAHGNPAITLGLWSLRRIPTTQAIAFIASQLLGGVAAMSLYQYLTGQTLQSIASSNFDTRVLVAEIVGTFIFGFGVAAAVTQKLDNWNWAVTVGVSLALGMMVASVASNGLLNPAVAIGTRSISQAYILGPLAGALVGMNIYQWIFVGRPARAAAVTTGTKTSKTKKTAKRRR